MPQFKILITDGLHPAGKQILRQQAEVDDRSGISTDELREIIADYDALIVRGRTKVTATLLDAANRLKVVGRAGVGVDNIDLAAAQVHGVSVVNAPTSTTIAVAEHTIGLMLALLRATPRADYSMKVGVWNKKELLGAELYGKTLGVVGMGRIGSRVAGYARAFGMHVVAFDPYLTPEQVREGGAEPLDWEKLLASADIITLHVPLTPQTRGMIDSQALGYMKRGVFLVNTSRGDVMDETALLAALERGTVAGVALDVFAKEPPGMTALVAHPRVIATPHIAAQTLEAQQRAARDIAEEVLAALQGKPLRWQVL